MTLIRTLVIALLFLTSISGIAQSDTQKVRIFFENEFQDRNSDLHRLIKDLMRLSSIPMTSELTLFGPEMFYQTENQKYHECSEGGCKAYQRTFFAQVGEIRHTQTHAGTSIRVWLFSASAYVMKVWKSNPQGDHLSLIKEEIAIANVRLL